MKDDQAFDEGLQLERTALAWQRTLLSLIVGSLAAGRGLEPFIGELSWFVAAVGAGIGVAAFVVARRRYLTAHRHLTTVDQNSLPAGGSLVAISALLCASAGVAALAFVLQLGA